MMSTTLDSSPRQPLRITQFIRDARLGSPELWANAYVWFVLFAVCSLLPLVDERLLNGVSVWEKPSKFFLSVAVHSLTLSWALSLVSEETRQLRSVRVAVWAFLGASWVELTIICGQSLRGVGSHFNTAAPLDGALYSIMGVGAILLTLTSGVIGFRIWQRRKNNLWAMAAGSGLMLGAVLTTVVAGYMSAQPGGHWVGGDLTDATGLPFLHWSTTGGDLRVPHFIALHASQIVPFAAISGRRSIVMLAAAATIAATAAAFFQAYSGFPLFRA
jgi:hypothetical protein